MLISAFLVSLGLLLASCQEFKPEPQAEQVQRAKSDGPSQNLETLGENAPTAGKNLEEKEGKTIIAGSGYLPPQLPSYYRPQSMPFIPHQPQPYPYEAPYYPPPPLYPPPRPFYQSNYLHNYDAYYSRSNPQGK